jgi:hypothetical protein
MYVLKQLGIMFITTMALAATATGQGTLTVTPGPLTVGQEVSIQYSNPNMAGQAVDVEINDCMGGPTQVVRMQLDENGNGTATWTVPNWMCAMFDAPEADGEARSIQP